MDERNLSRLRKRELWNHYRDLYEAVLGILFRHDPIGICDSANPGRETEYANEVDTILPRLKEATSVHDLRKIVHEEFFRWFGSSPGSIEQLDGIATDIWNYLTIHDSSDQLP